MAKKSKWFRVALAGATTDGREITDQDIKDMAATYDPATYGARVNLEHYRGLTVGSPFDMLGDVLALKSQEDELTIGGKTEKRFALYAEIAPLDNLIKLNDAGQKIYTSIEIQPDFAKTGKAGLVGLAVTDSPASLGTEVLKFSAKNPAFFAGRKQDKGNLFTEAQPAEIEFIDVADETGNAEAGAFSALTKLFNALIPTKTDPATKTDTTPPKNDETGGAGDTASAAMFTGLVEGMAKMSETIGQSITALSTAQKKQADDLAALTKKLDEEPDTRRFNKRQPVSGSKNDGARAFY